jgi:adenylate cyclase
MRNRLRAAKQAIDKSLGLDPTHAMANYYRGLLHRQAGEQEEAAAAYERALRQRPRFADARHNLAHVRLTQGRLAEALQALRETVDRSPDFLPSLSLLGLLLSTHPDDAVRDGPAALRYAERALELSGESDGDAHATRAFALAELGRFAEALEALEVAAQHSSVPTQWDEVVVLLQAGKPFRVDPLAGTGAD